MVKLFAEYQLYLKAAGHLSWRRGEEGGGGSAPPYILPWILNGFQDQGASLDANSTKTCLESQSQGFWPEAS